MEFQGEDFADFLQVASRPEGKGWVAISHAPTMLNSLMLVAWVQGREIQTSFRYATYVLVVAHGLYRLIIWAQELYTARHLRRPSLIFTTIAHHK